MGTPLIDERVVGLKQHRNYGDLQPIARSMKPVLWDLV